MILAHIEDAEQYIPVHPEFEKAFAYLRRQDLGALPPGRYNVEGDEVYCMVSAQQGKTAADARLEAHRRYIDIHCVLAGTDTIGWKLTSACQSVDSPFNEEKDIALFGDSPCVWFPVHQGVFAVFFPEDAHAPMVSEGVIHKVVMKVLL